MTDTTATEAATTYLVTASNGHLGHLVVEALLARGIDPAQVVAGARSPEKIADFAARGVRTVELDYDRPDTIASALDGVVRVLLISGSVPGARVEGHRNVIEAARAAGVDRLVYTSAPQASTFDYALGADHRATEAALIESGLPAVVVRNNWYHENYAADIARAIETGVVASSVGDARIASASRADYAAGAAAALVEDGHVGQVYEFAGDVAWTFDDFAAAASEALGREVVYERLTSEQLAAGLAAAGLDEGTVGFVVGLDQAIAAGVLASSDGTLSRIIGRPTTPLVDGLRALRG
jgi:NAD(P)H dehydrogenase (quinone)